MAQIEINQEKIIASEGTALSDIPLFNDIYTRFSKENENLKVWVRSLEADSAILVSRNEQGRFDYKIQNGDVIMIEQISRYGINYEKYSDPRT